MSPLKRLFGSRSNQPSLEQQLEALGDKPESELLALVQGDSQEALREAALNHLSYNQTLLNLALNEGGGRLQQSARKRIGQLLEAEQVSVEELARSVADQAQLLALSSYSARAGQQVLDQISEPTLLLELAIHGASIQIRRAAAERLESRAELEALAKAAQGRDKTVYKLAKSRLETFKAEDARRAEAEARALVICDKIEQLVKVEQDPMFQAKLDKLSQDWAGLETPAPKELAQRYDRALAEIRAREVEREQLEARVVAQDEAEQALQEHALEAVQTARTALHNLTLALYQADTEALKGEAVARQISAIDAALATLDEPHLKDQQASLRKERDAAAQLLSQLQEQGSIPHWVQQFQEANNEADRDRARKTLAQLLKGARALPESERPALVQTALAHLDSLAKAEKSAARDQQKRVRELEGLTRQGLSAAERGQVRRARGLHRATQEKRTELEPLPNHLASKLEELDAAINRLSDWHEFAVTPKKEALIRKMRELENTRMNPEELARKIHHLQDDWREVSKGVPHHDEDLWHQFQEASHKAFEPCREFFEAQAREREVNQAKREELIEQVALYVQGYDWDHPVWKEVEHTLKQARREWRDAWPVPRQSIKEQEARFEPLMDTIHAHLSEGYDAHRVQKEQLVERARALSDQEDLNQAIEGAKQLQAQWKNVGQCRPRDDQALWKQFRKHCDAIFERRQEQFQAADQEREANAEQARAIIAQLQALKQQADTHPGAIRGQINELKTAFRDLGPLPRAKMQDINDDFQKTLKTLDQYQRQARHQAQERQRQQLFNAAEAVRAVELASLEGSDTTAAREEADIALEAVEQWPGDSRAQLTRRLAEAAKLSAAQQAESLEAARLLCIRAEILHERETPEEDRGRRMEYQMQRLQQGLGQSEDSTESLLQEWLALAAIADPDYAQLLARLQNAEQAS